MTLRVLLVEDSHGTHELIAQVCASIGCRFVGAIATEAEALLWLDEHKGEWDVAIVDLILEQGSGISVIGRAKLSSPSGIVVVFSSYASPGIREHCLALGAQAVVDKGSPTDLTDWLAQRVDDGEKAVRAGP